MRRHASARSGDKPSPVASRAKARARPAAGNRPVGHRAAVDAACIRAKRAARHVLERAADALLHGMIGAPVALGRLGQMPSGGQHGRMLARAVVVGGRWRGTRSQQLSRRRGVRRLVRAASQRWHGETDAGQHRRHAGNVRPGAGMGAAGERDLWRAETEAVGGAALQERQRLQRLDGGAREDRPGDVADGRHHLAVGAHHGDGAGVHALHQGAARELDQDGVAHGLGRHAGLATRNSRLDEAEQQSAFSARRQPLLAICAYFNAVRT